jgi:benzylsuccinate CoA-transferase BbsF subunit
VPLRMSTHALAGIRVCDLSGQLAGAGATRTLAAFGAQVIRIEDPVARGGWDRLRGVAPFVDERRGNEFGGAFNNHNVGKLGITLNSKTERGRALLAELIGMSDIVTENFSSEVLTKWGFSYERMQSIRADVIYVSNCGFGHTGPYTPFRTWGPIVQALCGLTFSSGAEGLPTGLGFSYMDHNGANFMTLAILMALFHRDRTGEGQWIDMSCVEAGVAMLGPCLLDWSVNNRPLRRDGMPDSNHSQHPVMVPHNIYQCAGSDDWVAIACRHDHDWLALSAALGEPWARDDRWQSTCGRLEGQAEIDKRIGSWTKSMTKFEVQHRLQQVGIPAAAVQKPHERIDEDPGTSEFGLWPAVVHSEMGTVRVDGIPAHFAENDWHMERGAPLLGEDNGFVYRELLGLSEAEFDDLAAAGVI